MTNSNNNFLPEDYKAPETQSNYLKFKKDWDTDFRIMSNALTGYVYFNKENKPQRSTEMPKDYSDAKVNEKSGKQEAPKHFRAFVVWDYSSKSIKILEITQKSIRDDIMAYYKNTKRGDPKDYDMTVTRTGEGLDTKYTVIANPKTALSEEQAGAYMDANVKIEKLLTWEDPFSD